MQFFEILNTKENFKFSLLEVSNESESLSNFLID
jgi:hypothetical protein